MRGVARPGRWLLFGGVCVAALLMLSAPQPTATASPARMPAAIAPSAPSALLGGGTPVPLVSELNFERSTVVAGEGGPATLTVTRTNANTGAIAVNVDTTAGTATSPSDYSHTSSTLHFADGVERQIVRVILENDATVEPHEAFSITLTGATGGAVVGATSQATVTIVDDDTPAMSGSWGAVSDWPTMPIHLHLLPTGKVMFWDRHGHMGDPEDDAPRLWDPAMPNTFTIVPLPDWDIFCSGHSLLADGRLLVVGGHIDNGVGTTTATTYDPVLNTWTALPNMNAGRWYPSSTTLATGDALVLAGTTTGYGILNQLPQVLQVGTGTWRDLSTAMTGTPFDWPDYYPFNFQAPNGKVFLAGPQQMARYLDTSGTGQWSNVAASSLAFRDYGSAVMYAPGKVMIVGGNPRDDQGLAGVLPSATAEVIDLNAPTPAWRTVSPMAVGRRHLNTTLLPDGTVLATGGTSAPSHDVAEGAVHFAELWDPNTEVWTPMASHARYRGYHSTAMLLPDGRVLVGGGGHPAAVGGADEVNVEIFSPPYLFKGPRPAIDAAPAAVTYGQAFFVKTPDAAAITSASLIRLSSVTHAFNENQRFNSLAVTQTSDGVTLTAPADAHLCPPGHYMLFLLNANGVPSVARIVRVMPHPEAGQNLVINGSFASALGGWLTFAAPDPNAIHAQMADGVMEFYRDPPAPGTTNQAVVFQEMRVPLAAGAPISASFSLGNSSTVRKRISVILGEGDFSDLAVCTFWLPAGAPLASYAMRTHTTRAWSNASIHFYAASVGSDGGFYRVDDVAVQFTPFTSATRTDCIDANAPPAGGGLDGPELIVNGGFATGTMAPWITFGTLTHQIQDGVLEFIRPSAALPSGVVLQATGQAAPSGTVVTSTFELGNSSAVRKRATILVHDLDFSDLAACTFWLEPGQPLASYSMKTYSTRGWANMTLSFYPATTGPEPWIRLDNVSFKQTPSATISGTDCVEPSVAPAPITAG